MEAGIQEQLENETHNKLVVISINGAEKKIQAGIHTVAEIKSIGGIPSGHELEEVIHGKLTPLPDDGTVTIKGGEKFISHPRDGASS